jgi:hypothetical protein
MAGLFGIGGGVFIGPLLVSHMYILAVISKPTVHGAYASTRQWGFTCMHAWRAHISRWHTSTKAICTPLAVAYAMLSYLEVER